MFILYQPRKNMFFLLQECVQFLFLCKQPAYMPAATKLVSQYFNFVRV